MTHWPNLCPPDFHELFAGYLLDYGGDARALACHATGYLEQHDRPASFEVTYAMWGAFKHVTSSRNYGPADLWGALIEVLDNHGVPVPDTLPREVVK